MTVEVLQRVFELLLPPRRLRKRQRAWFIHGVWLCAPVGWLRKLTVNRTAGSCVRLQLPSAEADPVALPFSGDTNAGLVNEKKCPWQSCWKIRPMCGKPQ